MRSRQWYLTARWHDGREQGEIVLIVSVCWWCVLILFSFLSLPVSLCFLPPPQMAALDHALVQSSVFVSSAYAPLAALALVVAPSCVSTAGPSPTMVAIDEKMAALDARATMVPHRAMA